MDDFAKRVPEQMHLEKALEQISEEDFDKYRVKKSGTNFIFQKIPLGQRMLQCLIDDYESKDILKSLIDAYQLSAQQVLESGQKRNLKKTEKFIEHLITKIAPKEQPAVRQFYIDAKKYTSEFFEPPTKDESFEFERTKQAIFKTGSDLKKGETISIDVLHKNIIDNLRILDHYHRAQTPRDGSEIIQFMQTHFDIERFSAAQLKERLVLLNALHKFEPQINDSIQKVAQVIVKKELLELKKQVESVNKTDIEAIGKVFDHIPFPTFNVLAKAGEIPENSIKDLAYEMRKIGDDARKLLSAETLQTLQLNLTTLEENLRFAVHDSAVEPELKSIAKHQIREVAKIYREVLLAMVQKGLVLDDEFTKCSLEIESILKNETKGLVVSDDLQDKILTLLTLAEAYGEDLPEDFDALIALCDNCAFSSEQQQELCSSMSFVPQLDPEKFPKLTFAYKNFSGS